MKRRNFLKGATLAGGATAIAAPAIAQSEPVIRWRCVSSFPKNIDVLYGCAEVMSKALAEATDNKFQIQVFAAGEVVGGLQALDATINNTVELCHSASYYYVGKDPTFAFGTHVPFGLNTRQQNAWMYHGQGKELLEAFYREHNVVAIPGGNTTTQMGGWFRKEINSVQDLRGLKFRISGLGGQVLAKIGVVPQQVGGGDIYPALERGTIDAAEFNGPYDDEKLGLYKVAPYYYYPGFWDGTSMQHFFINAGAWEKLPKHYQAALRSAAALSNIDSIARYDVLNPKALRSVVGNGAQLRAFPNEVVDAAYDASKGLYEELSGKSTSFKKMYESMLTFQRESAVWNQVSEYAYDTMVMRSLRR
ncbi:TRAP transporter substrate-binding protein [Microvirga sp. G4-2]|uniref:TRAP transporter substrate-binding protein n=1 Tax=Microvirga sp. G4-2 TaxID=3434467 RepID=UPI004043A3CE